MDFLANENFPLFSIRLLRNAGHKVTSVIEETPGEKDHNVLKRAYEENHIVLTFIEKGRVRQRKLQEKR
ncbi:MAG: DUF5615 family PIN-like protein [Bacteroidota bacterium]